MKKIILLTFFLLCFGLAVQAAEETTDPDATDPIETESESDGGYKEVRVGGIFSTYKYVEADGYIYLINTSGTNCAYGVAYVCPKEGFKHEYKHISVGTWFSSYDYVKAHEHIYLRNSNGTEGGYGIAHAGICPCRKKK